MFRIKSLVQKFKQTGICFERSLSTKFLKTQHVVGNTRVVKLTLLTSTTLGYFWYKNHYGTANMNAVRCESEQKTLVNGDEIILYQFASCPFCNKVRTFLDYYGLNYKIVEVDPIFKNEIKFSQYRKVPIIIIQGVQVSIL